MLLSIAMGLAGTAMGIIDTIANLQLVKLYQKDSAVFLQVRDAFMFRKEATDDEWRNVAQSVLVDDS